MGGLDNPLETVKIRLSLEDDSKDVLSFFKSNLMVPIFGVKL